MKQPLLSSHGQVCTRHEINGKFTTWKTKWETKWEGFNEAAHTDYSVSKKSYVSKQRQKTNTLTSV